MPVIDPTIRVPVISQREFDIRHYGAAGNGTTDNTDAIVNAVTSAFESGGGRVVVPGGSWLTGPIALLSGVELSLDEHAELRMIGDAGLFQSPEADRGLLGAWLPLILARGCSGVALTGRGRIACGDATHWIAQPVSRSRGRKPIDLPAPHPALFKAIACDGLVIEHLRFDTGACVSAVSVSGSRHVTIRHITVSSVPRQDRPAGGIDTRQAESRAPGVMIDSSSEVVVEECDVSADGDGVVVRSRQPLPSSGGADSSLPTPVASLAPVATPATGPDALEPRPASTAVVEDERGPGTVDEAAGATPVARPRRRRHDEASVDLVPSRDIVLRRLRVSGGAAAVVIGDVHGGGVSNVLVEQCYCDGVRLGVRIEAPRRRGQVVENVVIRNTAMGRIDGQAILLATGPASPSPSTLAAPVCRNIHLSGVECRDAREAVRMVGANQGALRQIRLENVAIASEEGLFCSGSRDVMLIDVRISPRFGPVLSLRDTVGVTIQGMSGAPGGNVFLDLRGRHTRDVRIMGDAHESIRPAVVIGVEVPRDALVHE